jgi:hypothetical protein
VSSLSTIEKRYFEKLLGMESGYVLEFSDATFGEFFHQHDVDIHSPKYQTYGTSKAKKLRSFWEQEPDNLVGKVLSGMMEVYKANGDLLGTEIDQTLLNKCALHASRLIGKISDDTTVDSLEDFLQNKFTVEKLERLPVESQVLSVIQSRLNEARKTLAAQAYLSSIFMCGSILEAVLLGCARNNQEAFNRAQSSAKNKDGSVRHFHEWSLAQLIDAACELSLLKPDVKEFSHGLRDFRNYIHPYQQLLSRFQPDKHTATVCFQVLNAALADITGER